MLFFIKNLVYNGGKYRHVVLLFMYRFVVFTCMNVYIELGFM